MLKKTTVVIADNYESASWAREFKRQHPGKIIKILALSFSAQSCLHQANQNHFDYFSVAKFPEEAFFSYHNGLNKEKTLSFKTKKLIDELVKVTNQLDITYHHYPIIKILELTYFSSFIEILRSYEVFKNIIARWHPLQYYIPKDHTSIFYKYLITHPTEKSKIVFYTPPRDKFPNISCALKLIRIHIQRPMQFMSITVRLIKTKFDSLLEKNAKIKVIFHSFGANLSFYNSFFYLLKTKRVLSEFYIVSGEHSLSTLQMLDKNTLNFHSHGAILSSSKNKEIEKSTNEFKETFDKRVKKLKDKIWKDLPPYLYNILYENFISVTKKNAAKIIRELITAEYLFKQHKIQLLITTSDPGPHALSFVFPAQKLGIETLVLLHGFFGNIEKADNLSRHYGVWGRITKQWFIENLKKKPKELHEIGFSLFDEFFQKRKAFWQQKVQPPLIKKPVIIGILLAPYTHKLPDPYIGRFLTEIFTEFEGRDSYEFNVRTHPYHNITDINHLQEIYKVRIHYNIHETIENFVKKSDIIVSLGTTAILWPLLYGKPLIHTQIFWGKGIFPLDRFQAAWTPKNAEHLFDLMEKIRKDKNFAYSKRPGQKKFLQAVLGPLDGKSSERLAELIDNLLSSKNAD